MERKTNNWIISLLLFTCFVLYAIIELRPSKTDKVTESTTQIKLLQKENDSLKKSNAVLDKEFQRLQEKAEQLQQIVIITSDSISQLKQKQHEKVNRIDQLGTDELFDFFAGYKTQHTVDR
ncbi:MAG TPA: hypothetical protein VLB84_02715 [Bacteroidia bacterium]|nr:hypothetical protein [Bacteroidia bacterium]